MTASFPPKKYCTEYLIAQIFYALSAHQIAWIGLVQFAARFGRNRVERSLFPRALIFQYSSANVYYSFSIEYTKVDVHKAVLFIV